MRQIAVQPDEGDVGAVGQVRLQPLQGGHAGHDEDAQPGLKRPADGIKAQLLGAAHLQPVHADQDGRLLVACRARGRRKMPRTLAAQQTAACHLAVATLFAPHFRKIADLFVTDRPGCEQAGHGAHGPPACIGLLGFGRSRTAGNRQGDRHFRRIDPGTRTGDPAQVFRAEVMRAEGERPFDDAGCTMDRILALIEDEGQLLRGIKPRIDRHRLGDLVVDMRAFRSESGRCHAGHAVSDLNSAFNCHIFAKLDR